MRLALWLAFQVCRMFLVVFPYHYHGTPLEVDLNYFHHILPGNVPSPGLFAMSTHRYCLAIVD